MAGLGATHGGSHERLHVASALDELVLADRAGAHTRAAEPEFRAMLDGVDEQLVEVVAAAWRVLTAERARDGVGEQEDTYLFARAPDERVCEPQAVVGALASVCGVVRRTTVFTA